MLYTITGKTRYVRRDEKVIANDGQFHTVREVEHKRSGAANEVCKTTLTFGNGESVVYKTGDEQIKVQRHSRQAKTANGDKLWIMG